MKYDELKTAEKLADVDPGADGSARSLHPRVGESVEYQLDQILAMKDTWLVFLIISAITLAIVLLLVIFLRNRIRIAVALIKEASK
jgi:choline transporter-like protein 2/4/5